MILCIDHGDRYIGLAVTDPDGRLALRYSTIDQKQRDALAEITAVIERERITTVVVGLPVSMSGRESQQTHVTRRFIDMLRQHLPASIEVDTTDERLTSWEAERQIKGEGGKATEAHAEAARLMLADYLTRKKAV